MLGDRLRGKWPVFLAIWIFATGFNISKAYHIDDTAYLEIAQWINQEPLRPMSGLVNWGKNEQPIHMINQPHLYFYLMALWGWLWGYGEFAMHALTAVFTALCIALIYRIADTVLQDSALLVTALLALSPAFVIGQNVMVDIPLLAVWLAFYLCLLRPGSLGGWSRWIQAGVLAGVACLIKYQSVVLIPTLAAFLLWHRKRRFWPAVIIPLAILSAWSWFNYLDYGGVHILNRPVSPFSLDRAVGMSLSWIICAGAVTPFALAFFPRLAAGNGTMKRSIRTLLLLAGATSALMIPAAAFKWIPEGAANLSLQTLFLLSGTGLVLTVFALLMKTRNFSSTISSSHLFLLYLWLFSSAVFVVVFAPFMATRHLLPSLVPLTLLLAVFSSGLHRRWSFAALALTILLTTMLAIHDWRWADSYRQAAARIAKDLPSGATVHFSGHWGWQWYATKNNMRQLQYPDPYVRPGDYMVIPQGLVDQFIDPSLQLEPARTYQDPFSYWDFFSTSERASFYASSLKQPPWQVTLQPRKPIVVYRVKGIGKETLLVHELSQ